jgi:hypothetical protein
MMVFSLPPYIYQDSDSIRPWLLASQSFPFIVHVLSQHLMLIFELLTTL